MSHREQLSRPPFRLRVFLPKCGTCYGVQGKAVYGHIELIMGCLGEAKKKKKKSGTREGSRRFKEEQEGEDGEVRG